jgi:type I restriction enzyme S subunit
MSGTRSIWPEVTLGEVCDFKYGKSLPESARADGVVPVFGSNGQVGKHDAALTAGPTIVIGRKGSFGEVNFSSSSCWPIDTTYYVDGTATKADLRWLAYRLASLGLNKLNRAAAVPGLNREDAYRQRLLLPPLPEQRRIAEILDKADVLRAKRRAALAQLDVLTQSIFLEMFGDPATNPKRWPVASLRNCTEKIQIGPFGSLLHQEDYVADGIPLVNPKHIQDGVIEVSGGESVTARKYGQLGAYHLRAGDVVMGRRGEMGRCAIVQETSGALLCGTGSLFIRPDNARTSSLFLWATLSSRSIKSRLERLSLGQTLPNLNSRIVEQLEIPLPPFDLQRVFASKFTAIEKTKAAHRASLADLDVLFASLQHRAFRGEL